ncbi:MAG: hypothetical protein QOD67_4431, partial [Caballeronia sp.]|nr:hypothetical protein [Caballeronia sp.]
MQKRALGMMNVMAALLMSSTAAHAQSA